MHWGDYSDDQFPSASQTIIIILIVGIFFNFTNIITIFLADIYANFVVY